MPIRLAIPSDIGSMVLLSEVKRAEYAAYQPLFWRKASDSAGKQQAYFEHLLDQSSVIMLIHETDTKLDGFIIATIAPAPPVYDIGGLNCLIDDFCVKDHAMWLTAGQEMLDEVSRLAHKQGAVQMVIVTGHHDEAKRMLLKQARLTIASEWHTKKIDVD